ncbi:MAG: hypothetical protein ACRDLA_18620 [Thermoleophilaceae bacterium]
MAREEPTWQPLSRLRLVGSVIDEGVADAETQYRLLLEAKHVPRVLDDHTVERTLEVYGETRDNLWVFEEQMQRWGAKKLTIAQRREIDRLALQLITFRENVESILAIAEELRGSTIEAVLAKTDLELGLEALLGGKLLPRRRAASPPRPEGRGRPAAAPAAVVAEADGEFRALVTRLGSDVAAARHLGLDLDEVSEAAQARSERLFWTVSDPNRYPGPMTHGAVAGAWLHGAMCAAVICARESSAPSRLIGTGDLMLAVRLFESKCDKTGDSTAALARFGMTRAELQPQFAALAPRRAAAAIRAETGAPEEVSRDLLGLFAVDGAAVVRYALERVGADPSPPPADITAALTSYREQQAVLTAAQANAADVLRALIDGEQDRSRLESDEEPC